MTGMFGKYKDAKDQIYDPENDEINTDSRERGKFINHECEIVAEVNSIRSGISENRGSDKFGQPYVIFDLDVVRVNFQKDHKPLSKQALEDNKDPEPAQPVSANDRVTVMYFLPKEKKYERMSNQEQYSIVDVTDAFAGLLGVVGLAVDMGDLDDLAEDDGAIFHGDLVGVKFYPKHPKDEKKKDRVYINENFFPVDPDTLERTDRLSVEEAQELYE